MRISYFPTIAGLLFSAGALAQGVSELGAAQQKQIEALTNYYACVKAYALRFVPTSASAGDIADASLSACQSQVSTLHQTTAEFIGSIDKTAPIVAEVKSNARGFAVRNVLEARHPTR